MIKTEIVADSVNEFNNRITTMVCTLPRFLLSELNTHRMFSRNSASSRAIPFNKMVEMVKTNPFIPIAWQKEHTGMQGTEYLDETKADYAKILWLEGRDAVIKAATNLTRECEVTKQLANRLLEAYMHHTVILTATEFENFFALRCPQYDVMKVPGIDQVTIKGEDRYFRSRKSLLNRYPHVAAKLPISDMDWYMMNNAQAEIHMMELAACMWDAYNESRPKMLKTGEWHIPFGDQIDLANAFWTQKTDGPLLTLEGLSIKIATARCARVSYTVVGEESKEPNYENDIKLHDRLASSGHMSPFEHCARAMSHSDYYDDYRHDEYQKPHIDGAGWCANFRGFIQYRKMLPNENVTK